MAQRLSTGDLGSVPSPHTVANNCLLMPVPGHMMPFYWVWQALYTRSAQASGGLFVHLKRNKISKEGKHILP